MRQGAETTPGWWPLSPLLHPIVVPAHPRLQRLWDDLSISSPLDPYGPLVRVQARAQGRTLNRTEGR